MVLSRQLFLGAIGAAFVTAALGTQACETPETSAEDPRPVLSELASNVVVPGFAAFDAEAEVLRAALADAARNPTEPTVTRARDAFFRARAAWKRTEGFRIGPPEIDTWKASIDFWPASPDAIAKAIAMPGQHTKESVAALGANAKGFMAIEYVLFDSSTGDTSVLPSLTTASDALARRAYLVALGEALRADAARFHDLWRTEGKNLGKELAEGTGFFVSTKVATDQLVRQACFAAIALESTHIGKPLGRQNGGTPVPSLEESPRSDGSLRDLASALEGISAVYLGQGARDGMGLSDLVRARSALSDDHVVGHLAATQKAISDIPPPLRVSLLRDTAKVQAAFEASRALKTSLTTEVVSALGTTLTFSDSDGD